MDTLKDIKIYLIALLPIIFPVFIVCVALLGITFLIYDGMGPFPESQRSPAAIYQGNLIDTHLHLAGYRKSKSKQVVTVSLRKSDRKLSDCESQKRETHPPNLLIKL